MDLEWRVSEILSVCIFLITGKLQVNPGVGNKVGPEGDRRLQMLQTWDDSFSNDRNLSLRSLFIVIIYPVKPLICPLFLWEKSEWLRKRENSDNMSVCHYIINIIYLTVIRVSFEHNLQIFFMIFITRLHDWFILFCWLTGALLDWFVGYLVN